MENSWGKIGNSGRFYFLGLQNHCEQLLQPWNWKTLAPWKKNSEKSRQCIKEQIHHFADQVLYIQNYVFPVVMYGCESWTIKKTESLKIDAFKMWCWTRLFRVPWTTGRSSKSILKKSILNIHWEDWCWNWSSNALATSCEEPIHWKRPWCGERLKAEREGNEKV